MGETASLTSLFISSFLGATLLPGGSEAVLFALLKAYPESFWPALLLASLGNTLGGMVTFGMGWLLPQTQQLKHVEKVQLRHGGAEHSGAGETASHPLTQTTRFERNVLRVRRWGAPSLLLAWTPLIGDGLCLAAGWLRLNPFAALGFMAVGKFARYALVAISA
ncbi:MAG TPA: DedA family protein [Gallionellaceae bacterium]|nr:DedA family protein [Gallionellaceae bacterium]